MSSRDATEALLPSWATTHSTSSYSLVTPGSSPTLLAANSSARCILLGRNQVCDIIFTDSSISRQHAAFFYDDRSIPHSLVVKDLEAKKGVKVNGVKLSKGSVSTLQAGDVIKFGNCDELYTVTAAQPLVAEEEEEEVAAEEEEEEVAPAAPPAPDYSGMTDRQIREAEIKAMMSSFDDPQPTYTKYEQAAEPEPEPLTGPALASGAAVAANPLALPISHTAHINHPVPNSVTSSLSFDSSCSRLALGSTNQSVKLFDFNGMDASHKPFRDFVADEGHPIIALSYSPSGSHLLAVTASAQPRIFDRNGGEVMQFTKGDVYITDVTKTKGHTAAVTDCMWHPSDKNVMITSSLDGSVRVWKLDGKTAFGKLTVADVGRVKNRRGQRTGCTTLSYDNEGKYIAFGTNTGAVSITAVDKLHLKPECEVWDAAGDETAAVTGVVFSPDNTKLAVRANNGCVSVYKFGRNDIGVVTLKLERRILNLETNYEMSNVAFSPDSSLVCVGTSVMPKSKEMSMLKFYKAVACSDEKEPAAASVAVEEGVSCVCVKWPVKLKQIFVALSNGECRVFYDPLTSIKGVTKSALRKPRVMNELDMLLSERGEHVGEVLTPFALPAFADKGKQTQRQKDKLRNDSVATKMPQLADQVPQHRNAAAVSMTMSHVDSLGMRKDQDLLDRDPRAALLKYANYNPTGVKTGLGSAYDKQPKILASSTIEEEQEKKRRRTEE